MRRVILTAALLVLVLVGIAPIVVMLAHSLTVDGAFSFDHYRQLLATGRSWQLLGNSLGLAVTRAVAEADGLDFSHAND